MEIQSVHIKTLINILDKLQSERNALIINYFLVNTNIQHGNSKGYKG